jgi:hypothetical protein
MRPKKRNPVNASQILDTTFRRSSKRSAVPLLDFAM